MLAVIGSDRAIGGGWTVDMKGLSELIMFLYP